MRLRPIVIVITALLLGSCASAPVQDYFTLPEAARIPPQGMAQLVFYYPYSVFWSGIKANVEIQRRAACTLKSGSVALKNIEPAAITHIAVSLCSTNGVSVLDLKTEADKVYYIRILPNDQSVTGNIGRYGLSGHFITRTVPGAFWVEKVDKAVAAQELQGLKIEP